MNFPKLALAGLLVLGAAACGRPESDNSAQGSSQAAAEANLEAENFGGTIDSDDAVMNEADLRQVNSSS